MPGHPRILGEAEHSEGAVASVEVSILWVFFLFVFLFLLVLLVLSTFANQKQKAALAGLAPLKAIKVGALSTLGLMRPRSLTSLSHARRGST